MSKSAEVEQEPEKRDTVARIPVDHGFALYSALSKTFPFIHGGESGLVGIHPIRGKFCGTRRMKLDDTSRLILRIRQEEADNFLRLLGGDIGLQGTQLRIGAPRICHFSPVPWLQSRLVVIKGRMDPTDFLSSVRTKLDRMGIGGTPYLTRSRSGQRFERRISGNLGAEEEYVVVRRTLSIHGREVVGYEVVVTDLTADESLLLQDVGLGGRRRLGCGLFCPLKG